MFTRPPEGIRRDNVSFSLPRRRAWRAAIYLGSFLLVLIAADMLFVQFRRTITPGYDTTRIVTPTQPDGSIDYLIAIDDYFGKGVTPQNNAAVLILQAIGRKGLAKNQPADGITDRLGMPPLPEHGDYFVSFGDYQKQHAPDSAWPDYADLSKPTTLPIKLDDVGSAWLKDNEKPLTLIAQASQRPRFFIPYFGGTRPDTLVEIMLPYVSMLRDVNLALRTRALSRLENGDVAGFRDDVLTMHRMARLLAQQASMIERIQGMSAENAACQTDRAGAASGKIPSKQAQEMAQELRSLGDLPTIVDSIDIAERYMCLDLTQVLARKAPGEAGQLMDAITGLPGTDGPQFAPPVVFNFLPIPYEQSMRSMNHVYDGMLAAMRHASYAKRYAAINSWERQVPEKSAKWIGTWDLTRADWASRFFISSLRHGADREDETRTQSRLTQIALALAAFKADHGSYPASLMELTGAYLQVVPDDLYSEKPFVYAPADGGYTLYSVGPNIVDDGGKDQKPWDDIVANSK
jgi:hypothetical protein